MKHDKILQNLTKIKDAVKSSLRKNGIVVPVKTSKGIKLDDYEVVLTDTGYSIFNKHNDPVHERIYFLQTAILVANSLALRSNIKENWLEEDRVAGALDFDIKLFDRRYSNSVKKNDSFGMFHYMVRSDEAKLRYNNHIQPINNAYFRLVNSLRSLEKSNKY